MIVQCGHFQSVVEQRRHDGIDLVFQQDKVSHHHVSAVVAFRQGEPSTKSERGWDWIIGDCDVLIVSWNVYFEHVLLVVARLADDLQNLLIIGRHLLGG